jgi:hypothetical protein
MKSEMTDENLSMALFPTLRFRFAKTMAHILHWYVVRGPENEAEYVKLFRTIAKHGIWEEFQGCPYQYWYPGDGYKYWRMTTDLSQSRVINRAVAA